MKRSKVKTFGQHFLKNPFVIKKIVHCIAPEKNDLIIEIGAGKGALTFFLAEKSGKLIAVEKDRNLIPFLRKKEYFNLEILEGDILKIDLGELIKREKNSLEKVKLVGSLPYSISSPLLFKILAEKELFQKCIFLLQKEVGERICAQPGSKKYAPLSVIFQIYFEAKVHFYVSPKSFSPPPKVESALISLTKREKPLFLIEKKSEFLKFLKGSFRHRRKTLFNNLLRLNYPHSLLKHAFQNFNLENSARAEELPIRQFMDLFIFLAENPINDN